ncbi:pyridoxal phosphate-dependent aminotransferase [Streptococcus sp. ZB199]|nr:pyridoxal phosphate-dependent aminotransferase [Streptococcus sp. ZB199]
MIENSLVEKDGLFQIDFDQLEKDIVEQDVKLYVLCNPHNPGGRVWDREVLEKIGHLCQKHGVLLVSDEIHQDLALYGHRHTSFNTVDPSFKDFSFILTSATKTFNIAGTKIPMWSLKIQSFVRLLNNDNWPITNMKSQAWAILQQKRLIVMVNLG